MPAILVAAAGFACSASVAGAQEALPSGEIVERIWAAFDSTQSYAAYLPSDYDASRRWPILFLMDPRGRALVPVALFQAAAEEHGYVLLSSYDTMSDGPREPNEAAIRAMVSDALGRLAVDTRRLYMVGFSGTAREAWEFASRIPDHVAGVIGFGAGLPGPWMDRALALSGGEVAYFGGAGTTDFNYEELRELDAALDDTGIQHRIEFFDGGHEWAPREICARAIEWMELQAIKAELRPRDSALLEGLYSKLLDIAEVIKPGNPRLCWFRARAYAQAGEVPDALDQVACLIDAGVTETVLEEDPYLAALRDDPRYGDLLTRRPPGDR